MAQHSYRVLVCGGRTYANYDHVKAVLYTVHSIYTITQIIHGAARGADTLAGRWARENKIPVRQHPADWNKYGKRAGFIRNQFMLDKEKPHMVVGFPGGTGTADMMRRAKLVPEVSIVIATLLVPLNSIYTNAYVGTSKYGPQRTPRTKVKRKRSSK